MSVLISFMLGLMVCNGLLAGTDAIEKPSTPTDIQAESYAEQALHENAISVLLTSGFLPNEPMTSSPRAYTLIPISAGVLWTLDEIGNDKVTIGDCNFDVVKDWFRGNTSFRFTPYYHDVVHGPESRFVGMLAGPQYNFVQKGWEAVPFIGAQVGFGFCDSGNSGHLPYEQGQDFCFSFSVNAGARYFFTPQWSVIGEVVYQHFSNAGLSEPARQNNGLDLFGPQVSLAYTF